jgi:glycosyltransferase involved in cell wall biosynthesis
MTSETGRDGALRVAFLMEQALGHVTYSKNLQAAFEREDRMSPTFIPVPFQCDGPLDRLPITRTNWTLRGSLRALRALEHHGGANSFDAIFVHTQTVALSTPLIQLRVPVIVSLDATPANFDSIGLHYQHRLGLPVVERGKRWVYERVFQGAAAITVWSQWAKDSLRDDYGTDPNKVSVIPPGLNSGLFAPARKRENAALARRRVRILFVGADFERKGGPELVACMRGAIAQKCEFDLVTAASVEDAPNIHVHRGLGSNDPALLDLYRRADIFVLPTHADCLAVAVTEAMAAGLPVIATAVGALPEIVKDGRTGLIVPTGDVEALNSAILRLAENEDLRRSMGDEGYRLAESRFDARKNAGHLVDVIERGMRVWRRQKQKPGASAPWVLKR